MGQVSETEIPYRYKCLGIQRQTADKAAELRRQKNCRLPDAFQAALCHLHNLKLVTRDVADFDPNKHNFVFIPYTLTEEKLG